jgi:hypothetical protein
MDSNEQENDYFELEHFDQYKQEEVIIKYFIIFDIFKLDFDIFVKYEITS